MRMPDKMYEDRQGVEEREIRLTRLVWLIILGGRSFAFPVTPAPKGDFENGVLLMSSHGV